MSALPPGWRTARIGELCTLVNGRAFKPTEWTPEGLPIIRIQNLNNPQARFNHYSGQVEPRFLVRPGELLFAWSGTPGSSFGAHLWRGGPAILNQHIFKVLFDERAVTQEFFQLALHHQLEELVGQAHGGVGLAHVTKGQLEATEVLVPPLAEQRRIVARLEALLARSRSARARLERVPGMIERLRHSLLAAAFRGELTARWRGEPPQAEGARTRLPATWTWTPLRELLQGGGLLRDGDWIERKHQAAHGSVRLIQLADIGVGRFRDRSRRFLTEQTARQLRCTFLRPGDLLIARMAEPLGRACLFPALAQPAVTVVDVCILRPASAELDARWLMHALNSPLVRASLLRLASGSTRARVSRSNLETVLLPVAPLAEQRAIATALDEALEKLDALERAVTRMKVRFEHLEKGALTRALRGPSPR